MSSVGVKDAKAGLSGLVDEAASGAFVTITRHGKPAAVLVSVEAAEAAKRELGRRGRSLVAHLKQFPGDIAADDEVFERNRTPSREIEL